jgi:hypothetical protein
LKESKLVSKSFLQYEYAGGEYEEVGEDGKRLVMENNQPSDFWGVCQPLSLSHVYIGPGYGLIGIVTLRAGVIGRIDGDEKA